MIATSSDDKTVRLWDPDTGKEIHVFNEAKGFASHLDWHPSGTCIGNRN
jgi:centriolar protein POC1